jgi:hypothetical protein
MKSQSEEGHRSESSDEKDRAEEEMLFEKFILVRS